MAIGQSMPKASLATSLSFPSSGSTRILGRKRIAVSPAPSPSGPHSPVRPLRKQRSIRFDMDGTVCLLESLPQDVLTDDTTCLLDSLPQDVLIKVLCKVNHTDLRQLLLVSKPVSEATVVAKELHFAFATPSKATAGDDEDEGPGAPKQHRVARSRLRGKNLASVTVNLSESFSSLLSDVEM